MIDGLQSSPSRSRSFWFYSSFKLCRYITGCRSYPFQALLIGKNFDDISKISISSWCYTNCVEFRIWENSFLLTAWCCLIVVMIHRYYTWSIIITNFVSLAISVVCNYHGILKSIKLFRHHVFFAIPELFNISHRVIILFDRYPLLINMMLELDRLRQSLSLYKLTFLLHFLFLSN